MDFDIPAELAEILGVTRAYARSDLRTAERALDDMADPVEAYGSELYRSVRKAGRAIGLHQLLLPKHLSGLDLPPIGFFLVLEELAAGGAGLALISLIDPLGPALVGNRPNLHPVYRDYIESFMEDDSGRHSGAWAITEPDVGCDIYSSTRTFDAKARPTPGGGGYVINGAKSSWCANGWMADIFVVMINVDPTAGMDGTGVFLIPGDWPGLERGRPISKVGLRALNQCDITFVDCEVPKEFLVFPPGPRYTQILKQGFVGPGNLSVGTTALGIAQAAYELGLRYAQEREQGGGPIAKHQLVAKKLFDAYAAIEASRLMLRQAAWRYGNGVLDMAAIYAARVTACRTAAQVSQDMMFLHGANGITKEYGVEKLWRDSQPLQIADGTTDVVSLQGASYLTDARTGVSRSTP